MKTYPTALLAGITTAIVGGTILAQGPKAAKPEAPEVQVARPVVRKVVDHIELAGRAEAASTVEVRPRVSGFLDKVSFKEGAEVKPGEVLFVIDARPYQAEVDKAEAGVAVAQAQVKRSDTELQRAKALVARGALSREELDKIVSEREEAEARLAVAKAAREVARLNLDFTRVSAPIDGRISRRFVDPGNVVKADETLLTTIISQAPIYVYFELDELTALRLMRAARAGELKAAGGGGLPVALRLATEESFDRKGVADFADNRIDPKNGTLRLRAVFENADRAIFPGAFARVRLTTSGPHDALLVPEAAVLKKDEQAILYVVKEDTVEARPVVLGAQHDGLRAISKGLAPEDLVIVAGVNRVRPGMTVRPAKVRPPD